MLFHAGLFGLIGRSVAIAVCGAAATQDPVTDGADSVQAPGQLLTETVEAQPSNVLLLVLDDIGPELIGCCPESSRDARTPRLDAFAKSGVRFDNLWSNPACSPTRATILTGRYGFRTGIGAVVHKANSPSGLDAAEVCIPEALHGITPACRTAFLGKWHLGVRKLGLDAPRVQGFEVFRGTRGNLSSKAGTKGYFAYDEILDGELALRETYATTATFDDALAAITSFGEDPWFVMASFHTAHKPLHAPPSHLHSRELKGKPKDSQYEHVAAMVEAFDTEFGRMLDALPASVAENTTIIVVSDNGTPSWARAAKTGARGGKGTLSEGGISVPMIVGGAGVVDPGRVVSHPVNTTDLFATVLDICSAHLELGAATDDTVKRDSVSFAPYLRSTVAPARRDWILSERFQASGTPDGLGAVDRVAMKLGRFKRIEDCSSNAVRLYDLEDDPSERKDLLLDGAEPSEAALAALARMELILNEELARKL